MLSQQELYVLSYYRACELEGAILFGKLAFHTTIDEYRGPLTRHCLEEAEHAWVWTKVIQNLGSVPTKVTQTYQTEYGKLFGMPASILEIFCLTQVFEKRTLDHFTKHLQVQGTDPVIKKALQKMIEDESGHIGWIKTELDKYERETPGRVESVMHKIEEMDRAVYKRISQSDPYKTYFGNQA